MSLLTIVIATALLAAPPVVGPPNGYLVIHGGGGGSLCLQDAPPAPCNEHLDEFVRLAGGVNASIVVIPTAALFEDEPSMSVPLSWQSRRLTYDHAFQERYASLFRSRGVNAIEFLHAKSRAEADSEEFAAPIRKASGVWLIGGRQWILADTYLGTRTERALWELLDRGGVIGGGSAAAAIQASYLVRGDPRGNMVISGDHEHGFGFLRNTAIDIHVLSWNRQFDLVPLIRSHPELLGIGIDADAAIVVHGDEFRVIGDGHVAIYDPGLIAANGRFYFLEWGERFDLATRTPIGVSGKRLSLVDLLPDYTMSPTKLAAFAGSYRYDSLSITISVRASHLAAQLSPDDERDLVPIAENLFFDRVTGSKVTFSVDENNQPAMVWEWPLCTMKALRQRTPVN